MTLARRLARERARLALALGGAAAARAVAAALVVLTAAALALTGGGWIAHPAAPLLAWGAALVVIATVAWRAAVAWRRNASADAVARTVESERGLRRGELRAALESAGAGALGELAAERMRARANAMGPSLVPAALSAARRRTVRALMACAVAVVTAAAAALGAADGWTAVRHPVRAYAGTLLPRPMILDAPASVLRGDTLRVRVAAPGRRQVTLRVRATGAAWSERPADVRRDTAAVLVGAVDADITLVAGDGRALSDTVLVRVRDRAFLGDVAITARYPAYLARAAEPLAAGEPVLVPRGTVLRLEARASADLSAAGLVEERAHDTVRLAPRGRRASGSLAPIREGRWHWFAFDASGAPLPDLPEPLQLGVTPDAMPRVEILSPLADTVLAAGSTLVLHAVASDDHGVALVTMRSWRGDGVARGVVEQQLAVPAAPAWTSEVILDLAARQLTPGDALHVVLRAVDDSPWRQVGESRELVVRVPTPAEARALARALGDSAAARTSAAAGATRDLARRTHEAARTRGDRDAGSPPAAERAGTRAMSFESAERAQALARAQEQIAARVREAERDAGDLERALRAAGALDTALARQLRDVRELLRDALTPEMARELAAVMAGMKQLSPEETRRALERLAAQQDRLRAELERTAAMLHRAALEGAMQTLRDDARDLAARARAVADSLARSDRAARQSAAATGAEARALASQITSLGDRLARERADLAARAMPAAGEHAAAGGSALSRSAGEPDGAAASRTADEGADQLARTAQELAAARDEQVRAWKRELAGELDLASAETMELARAESELAQRAAASSPDSGLRAEQSAVQQGVDRVGQRLERAAGQSAHVSPQSQRALAEARRRVAEATREIAESTRGARDAAPQLGTAAQALSSAAAQMMRDRARAAGAQSASGFAELMQRLSDLAKQQGGLNAQAEGLLPAPGGAPGAMEIEGARALARQQRALAAELERAAGGDARAAQLAAEMRDIASALETGRVDATLLARQQRLFHRLLDAGLAMEKEEREDTGRRESRSAEDTPVGVPGAGAATGARAAARYAVPAWPELRSLTVDEREAVLDYFTRLNDGSPR